MSAQERRFACSAAGTVDRRVSAPTVAGVRLTIRGENLPGRVTGSYRDVHVALQVRQELVDPVPGDAPSAEWETVLTPVRSTGEPDFRGPAVHGRRGDRFIYLSWFEWLGPEQRMFRRAKLMLNDAIGLLSASDAVVVTINLTDDHGSPRCARLKGESVRWGESG